MKKLLALLCAVVALGTFGLFAEDAEVSETGSKKNLLTFEVTGGVVGFGINEVVTYNYMFSNKFGIGAGINASEGMVGTIDGFVDFKVGKWNFGIGGGYSYSFAESSSDFMVRAIHHGNSWDWGPFKAGLTLGTDWHMFSVSGGESQADIIKLLGIFPRFILGVNMELGM